MKKFAMLTAAVLFSASPLFAADTTLKGTLSDAKCAGTHHKAEHGSQDDSDHDCVTKCVEGGSKMVLMVGKTPYQIANQDFAGLKDHGGHHVALTGEVNKDTKTITVSKIEMEKAPAAKGK
jgi:hypothetical protein